MVQKTKEVGRSAVPFCRGGGATIIANSLPMAAEEARALLEAEARAERADRCASYLLPITPARAD